MALFRLAFALGALCATCAVSIVSAASPLRIDVEHPDRHDLAAIYPATRDWSAYGLSPVSTADDVWRLRSFSFNAGDDLSLHCDDATLVIGRDGTDVLWAVVLPDRTAAVRGSKASENEHAVSILLRFAPSEVGALFPPETVLSRGDAIRRFEAQRIARRKMVWRWTTQAGNPTIVPKPIVIVDIDTEEGPRRFWAINRQDGSVHRVDDFIDQPTPPMRPLRPDAALAAFDEVWSAFDREYAGFVLLPHVDWNDARERYRARVERVRSTFALAAILADMLAELEDLHVWVRDGDDWLVGYTRDRPLNASFAATRSQLSESRESGSELLWGRTHDGIGYLGVFGLNDEHLPHRVDDALSALRDTSAMIVDLRFCGGGDELLGRAIAGRFIAQPTVYSRNRYRNGPAHDDLGPLLDRIVEPRGPWRYDKPVVCLFGPHTLSSAESLAAMFAQCENVTTMGTATGGSSANPRRIELDCGITVNLPRWLDLLPDGTPIERHGVQPQIKLDHLPDAFTAERDPVFEAALARLRAVTESE
jgi:hypothetical protein